jgi:hypothetical protein
MYMLKRCLLVVAVLAVSFSANAAMVFMKANLANEVGVVGTGEGSAFVSVDTTAHTVSWAINYRNLNLAGNQYLFSHFHGPTAPGGQAGIQVTIDATGMPSPLIGSAALAPQQEADLLAGLYYINLHTLNFPGGEIRGTVLPIDTNFFDVFTSAAGVTVPSDHLNGTVMLDPATLMLTWNIAWGEAMASTATDAALHCPARVGQTAPMVVDTGVASNNLAGSMTITAPQAAELINGFCYFQVDKAAPVIRAQLLPSHPRLANISTRAQVLTGNDVVIAGFIIGGPDNKTVAITAQGPSLVPAGIPNAIPNPRITVVKQSDGSVVATNDDFRTQADAGMALDIAGLTPPADLDAALVLNLAPGAYTAIVDGVGGTTGVGLVAVFEIDHLEVPLINISTRAQVLTGNDVVIGGFIIQGNQDKTVVVTATGPSLVGAGIANALADPTLTLVRASDGAVIATNDDWQTAANAAQLMAAGFAPADAKESAIMMTLPPGAYTAVLSGMNGGTGVGIIAVFSVQ